MIFRAAPGRGASPSPSIRRSMNRTRHLRTDSRDSPVRAATRVSGATPPSSAQARTTRARSASDCDAVRLRDKASSDARSASDKTSGTSFGLGTSQAYNLRTFQRLRTLEPRLRRYTTGVSTRHILFYPPVSVSGHKYSWSMARDQLIALAERQHVHDLDAPEDQVRTSRVSVVNSRKLKEKNG